MSVKRLHFTMQSPRRTQSVRLYPSCAGWGLLRPARSPDTLRSLVWALDLNRFLISSSGDTQQEWGAFPGAERVSPVGSLTYDEYKNNVSAEVRSRCTKLKSHTPL